jgi:hypothetical protein
MVQAVRPAQDSAAQAARAPASVESAASLPVVSSANRLLSTQVELHEPAGGELETDLLIEMRYQQHLAQRALEELFENGGPGLSGS